MTVSPLEALPLDQLRRRSSTKWRTYPDDVLPLFVAESDYPSAPAIEERLRQAVALGDTGYTPPDPGVKAAFAGFAARRFGWEVRPDRVRTTCDVMMGVVEVLRRVIAPGDRVVVTPPVYPPFYDCVAEAGGVAQRVPLVRSASGWELDLPAVDEAFAQGATAILLCNPHNPTGTVHTASSLRMLAKLVARYRGHVISDEIHAPMTMPGVAFTPFLTAGEEAAEVGITVTSASKAFNTAGLKCAFMVAASDDTAALLRALPAEVEWRTGLFGALAAVAALDGSSDDWLDRLVAALDANRRLLADLLATHLPTAQYRLPQAGYLAWVDLSALGWGDDPARRILKKARVALNSGPTFGNEGEGHVRINYACSPEVLTEAVERIAALA